MISETVLVVDDEWIVREFCSTALARAGYQALQAGSGDEALQLVKDRPGLIDLALLDIVMPGMSGLELAQRLAGQCARIALMSGYTPDELKQRIGGAGAEYHLLTKPFDAAMFVKTIRDLLDARP